jgi:hypothetical protein
MASQREKLRLIAQHINSLLATNDAVMIVDRGGLLTDAGSLAPEINEVVSFLEARPHPPAVFIAPRMIPQRARRRDDDVSYLSVRSLKPSESERLIGALLKDSQEKLGSEEMSELVKLGDGHPFNIYQMANEVKEKGLSLFLANPRDFTEWKHRHDFRPKSISRTKTKLRLGRYSNCSARLSLGGGQTSAERIIACIWKHVPTTIQKPDSGRRLRPSMMTKQCSRIMNAGPQYEKSK